MAVPRIFYPYPTVRAGRVEATLSVEGEPDGVSQLTHGSVAAEEAAEPFFLEAVFQFQTKKILDDLGLRESEAGQVGLVVVESGVKTRIRRQVGSFPLGSGDRVTMRLEFDPSRYRGDVELQAYLVYAADSSQEVGARCGESDRMLVHFDDYRAPPGAGMEIRWVDFTELDRYAEIKGELFALDLVKEPPVLLLNQGIKDFKRTLMSRGTRGSAARIRESQFVLIGSQVWQAMLSEALGRLMEIEGDGDDGAFEEIVGWREKVLSGWAPALTKNRDSGIKELASTAAANPDKLILEDLPKQIQLRMAAGKNFAALSSEFLEPGSLTEVAEDA